MSLANEIKETRAGGVRGGEGGEARGARGAEVWGNRGIRQSFFVCALHLLEGKCVNNCL